MRTIQIATKNASTPFDVSGRAGWVRPALETGHTFDDQHGRADLDPIALAEDHFVDPHAVHARAIRAAQVAEHERPMPGLDSRVPTRHRAIRHDDHVVRSSTNGEQAAIEIDGSLRPVRSDLAQDR